MTTLDHRTPEMTSTEIEPSTVRAPGTDLVPYAGPALEVRRPRQPGKVTDYWTAALKFYATGRTAEGLRAMAADREMTRGLALLSRITEDEEREQVLGIASAIDALTAEGLTPEKCYFLAGLDRLFGPWVTPSYCGGCHRNHPGACACPCHVPAGAVPAQAAA